MAYVVTKIAVGIFAGGIVFSVLLPEIRVDLGFMILDSFWIGSILVLAFTGVYTTLTNWSESAERRVETIEDRVDDQLHVRRDGQELG